MPNQIQIAKWGHSLAVRIPRATVREAGLSEGDRLSIHLAEDGVIVLRPSRRRYSLDQLVKGITRKNRHPETNWGAPRGNESW